MKIYVRCLASHTIGLDHGEWIDLEYIDTVEDLQQEIDKILYFSPVRNAEEWVIHDYDLDGIDISEHESLDHIIDICEGLKEHGDAFVAYYELFDSTDLVDFEDRYQGEYDDLKDYAYQFLNDTGMLSNLPENLQHYFDYESYGNDCEMSGDISSTTIGGKLYVFMN